MSNKKKEEFNSIIKDITNNKKVYVRHVDCTKYTKELDINESNIEDLDYRIDEIEVRLSEKDT